MLLPQGVSGAIKKEAGLEPFREVGKAGALQLGDGQLPLGTREQAPSIPRRQGDLVIDASADVVRLGLRWNAMIGQPRRRAQLGAIALSKGRTARLVINGRYTNHSGQFYTEATYNVAFDDVLRSDVFLLARNPAFLDMRADLF